MENVFTLNEKIIAEYIIPSAINLAIAILIYITGRIIIRLLVKAIKRLLLKANVDTTLASFIAKIANVGLTIVVIIAALEQLGVDTTSVMAIFAAAGLAIGLALKDSLSNFSAGVMLVLFKPFKTGDVITAAGTTGKVESIKLFNSILCTADNQEVIIPNSLIFGGTIINITAKDTRRIDLVIGISYEDNIKTAKETLENIVQQNKSVLSEPAAAIMVLDLAESSVNLAVRSWVNTTDYWKTRAELLQTIKETFDEKGISIPYPQTDIHIINSDSMTSLAS